MPFLIAKRLTGFLTVAGDKMEKSMEKRPTTPPLINFGTTEPTIKDEDEKIRPAPEYSDGLSIMWPQSADLIDSSDGTQNYLKRLKIKSLPKNYKVVVSHALANRRDKYLLGHPSGKRYRSPNEFQPHLEYLYKVSNDPENPIQCKCCLCSSTKASSKSSVESNKRKSDLFSDLYKKKSFITYMGASLPSENPQDMDDAKRRKLDDKTKVVNAFLPDEVKAHYSTVTCHTPFRPLQLCWMDVDAKSNIAKQIDHDVLVHRSRQSKLWNSTFNKNEICSDSDSEMSSEEPWDYEDSECLKKLSKNRRHRRVPKWPVIIMGRYSQDFSPENSLSDYPVETEGDSFYTVVKLPLTRYFRQLYMLCEGADLDDENTTTGINMRSSDFLEFLVERSIENFCEYKNNPVVTSPCFLDLPNHIKTTPDLWCQHLQPFVHRVPHSQLHFWRSFVFSETNACSVFNSALIQAIAIDSSWETLNLQDASGQHEYALRLGSEILEISEKVFVTGIYKHSAGWVQTFSLEKANTEQVVKAVVPRRVVDFVVDCDSVSVSVLPDVQGITYEAYRIYYEEFLKKLPQKPYSIDLEKVLLSRYPPTFHVSDFISYHKSRRKSIVSIVLC